MIDEGPGVLCRPTGEAIALIHAVGLPIVEIGAGDGYWLRAMRRAGISAVAYDRYPRGVGVRRGDHLAAADPTAAMLSVWPPDGEGPWAWVRACAWRALVICGEWKRFGYTVGLALERYELTERLDLPPGRKGGSELRLYRLA